MWGRSIDVTLAIKSRIGYRRTLVGSKHVVTADGTNTVGYRRTLVGSKRAS
ncbi:hypothetical protein NJ7G_0931 [Natrinema sp. J7-2]|nr:hypothetical protein NJ7G_0931 [Natrinema sp. J7-2]